MLKASANAGDVEGANEMAALMRQGHPEDGGANWLGAGEFQAKR